jgi:prevent-host-death family protein
MLEGTAQWHSSVRASKRPLLTEDLVPVNEFRSNLAEWMKKVEDTQRPVVVTQRGRSAAVLVSPAMLDEVEEERALLQVALRGMRESEAGEFVEDEQVWAEVDGLLRSKGAQR